MAPNKRKILESARKYAQKGQKDRALKEYEKLLKLDPRDAKLRLEIGDAYRRWGQVDEAIGAYMKVAQQYMTEGFDARAVAVFKQIQNLDSDRYDAYVPLAELYERMGLTAEAIQALQTAADGYRKEGRKREALDLLRRMAGLDPSNTTSRIKVADLLRQEGMVQEAVQEYEASRAELERQGEHDTVGSVLERILEADPERVETMAALARNLLKRGMAERAEPFAKRALERDREEPDHYELLADVYRAGQRDDELRDTYKGLAELFRQRGDEDRARDIIQRFVPLDDFGPPLDAGGVGPDLAAPAAPSDLEHEELLGDDELLMDEPLGSPGLGGSDEPLGSPGLGGSDEPLLELTDEAAGIDPEPRAAPQPSAEDLAAELEPPPVEGDPDQLLAEASVYLRYGKRAQAVRNLEAIIDREPQHRVALEKLGEAHADDNSAAAVAAWLRAAEIARDEGDPAALSVLRDRIRALDREAAESLETDPEPVHEVDDLLGTSAPGGGDVELDLDEDVEIDIDASDLDEGAEPEAVEAPPAARGSVQAEASGGGGSTSTSQQIQEELEEAEFYTQQGLVDEARAIYTRILELAPNHPLALVRMGELAAGEGGADAVAPPQTPEREVASDAAPVDLATPDDDVGEDLVDWDEEDLGSEEIDIDSGVDDLDDEVEISLDDDEDDLAAGAPEVDGEADTAADLDVGSEQGGDTTDVDVASTAEEKAERPPAPAPAPTPPPAAAAGGDFVDLAAEINQALDDGSEASSGSLGGLTDDDGFAAVFREFKKGVKEQLGEGDQEAHWDLGIAYREMGLLEDAIGEFEQAMTSPNRRIEGLHMIGICALELGRAEDAVARLGEALASAGISAEQMLPLRFDQGRAFEALGRIAEARAAWEAVAEVDPDFCEVGERLATLGEAKPAPPAASDGFESFDDLMAEAQDDDTPAAEGHESFEDLIEEAGAPAPEDSGSEATDPDASASGSGDRPRRKKKKKISFV